MKNKVVSNSLMQELNGIFTSNAAFVSSLTAFLGVA